MICAKRLDEKVILITSLWYRPSRWQEKSLADAPQPDKDDQRELCFCCIEFMHRLVGLTVPACLGTMLQNERGGL